MTSQARNKKYNRKIEKALRELEFVASLTMMKGIKQYPSEELDSIWKEVMLYQFHDILPGSSISRVYDESLERYQKINEKVERLIEKHYQALYQHLHLSGITFF